MDIENDDAQFEYYRKVMAKLFPYFDYDPHFMSQPTTEFVLDIMKVFVNYIIGYSNNIPSNIRRNFIESATMVSDGPEELVSNCNEILRRFNFGSELSDRIEMFDFGDVFYPDGQTVKKIKFVLSICIHISSLNIYEQFEYIQQTLEKQTSVQSYDQLMKRKMDLEVASACLQHKRHKLKSNEALEVLSNTLLNKATKSSSRKEQLKNELDNRNSILLQREKDSKRTAEDIKFLEDKLIDDSCVEDLKLDLKSLQSRENTSSGEKENLINKINNTKPAKKMIDFQLYKISDYEDNLKQHEDLKKVEDDSRAKLESNDRANFELFVQINYCNNRINVINKECKENMKMKLAEAFQTDKTKIKMKSDAEDKKHGQLKAAIAKSALSVKELLINIEAKCQLNENLTHDIQQVDSQVKLIIDLMIKQTVEKCMQYNKCK